jgi:hypothetical protein
LPRFDAFYQPMPAQTKNARDTGAAVAEMPFENCGAGMILGVVIPWGRTVPAVAALVVCSHFRAPLSRAAFKDLLGKPCFYFSFDPPDGPSIA